VKDHLNEYIDEIAVKGRGKMEAWYLLKKKENPEPLVAI
jgi:hypothetical protein